MEKYYKEYLNRIMDEESYLGAIQIGSSIYCKHPNDIDLIIITNNYYERRFEIVNREIPLEIEYIGFDALKSYYDKYFWYTENLIFEIGKFSNSRVLFDQSNLLKEVLNKITKPNIDVKLFIISFLIGDLIKLIKTSDSVFTEYYFRNVLSVIYLVLDDHYPIKRLYPYGIEETYFNTIANFYIKTLDKNIDKLHSTLINLIQKTNPTIYKTIQSKEIIEFPLYYPQNYCGFQFLKSGNTLINFEKLKFYPR